MPLLLDCRRTMAFSNGAIALTVQTRMRRLESSSVYYTLHGNGSVQPSGVMTRTKREPFVNIIGLPGRPELAQSDSRCPKRDALVSR